MVMRLSTNFTLEELYQSDTASRLGINNVPGEDDVESLKKLVTNILQPLRDYFFLPVTIRSGYRSAALNRSVGGEITSQHLHGEAADIIIHGVGNDHIWQYIKNVLPFDQLILEHVPVSNTKLGWVHVSYSNRHRRDAISCPSAGHYVEGLVYAD